MMNFYGKRKIFYIISAVIALIGIIGICINGVALDISFKGGAIIKYTYEGEIDTAVVNQIANESLGRNVTVQTTTDIATGTNRVVLNVAGNEAIGIEQQNALETALNEKYAANNITLSESNNVQPFIGARYLKRGILALVIAFALIVVYVWIRFKQISGLSAGVVALLALLHDCLVVFFTFVIFKMPLNDNFIAVLLTIIGFSVNDTIIIYDRIRENKIMSKHKMPIEDLVNKSITQSLTRSINTGGTTFLSVAVVYIFACIFGIDPIKSFALPLSIGLLSGCYSTICIAGPVWVSWQKYKEKRRKAA